MNNTTQLLETADCNFDDCYTEQELIFISEVQIIFLVLYGLVTIIGTIGNLFIVITVLRTPSLRTGINLFVCNMALSDMMMCLTASPLTPITSFSGRKVSARPTVSVSHSWTGGSLVSCRASFSRHARSVVRACLYIFTKTSYFYNYGKV